MGISHRVGLKLAVTLCHLDTATVGTLMSWSLTAALSTAYFKPAFNQASQLRTNSYLQ